MKALRIIGISLLLSFSAFASQAGEMSSEADLVHALNTYTYEQLLDVRGITFRRANSIVLYRSMNQNIDSIADLDGLPGFESNPFYKLIEQSNVEKNTSLVALNTDS